MVMLEELRVGNATGLHSAADMCGTQHTLCRCRHCTGQGYALEYINLFQIFYLEKIRQEDVCVYLWLLAVLKNDHMIHVWTGTLSSRRGPCQPRPADGSQPWILPLSSF